MNSGTSQQEVILGDFIKRHGFHIPPKVTSQIKVVYVGANSAVLLKGELVENVFIVLEGRFSIEDSVEKGGIFMFTCLGKDDFIGELEALSDIRVSQYFVRSQVPSLLICLPVSAVEEWIRNDTSFCAFLIHSLVKKFNSVASTASGYPFTNGLAKLAKMLVNYVEENPTESECAVIKLTRQDMGDTLGLSIRTVNRNLKKLEETGVVYIERGKIVIPTCKLELLRKLYHL